MHLESRNRLTGEILETIPCTSPESLPTIMSQARHAQNSWAILSPRQRAKQLLQLRETLLDSADALAQLISKENGKPPFEALANEILPAIDCLTHFASRAPRLLRDRPLPLKLLWHRKSTLNYWPLGTVAVIAPWNYPFLLPFARIIMALVAGNAVVFKPSEESPLVGLKIQELFDNSGFPRHILQTIVGDGELGAALIENKPAKIFFTGSVATGKKVMAAAARHLIPINLELGGKDALIVLQDADLDFATSAALWGGFSNSGQMCASVERAIVHESIAEEFSKRLTAKIAQLRHATPSAKDYDLGPFTALKQKEVYLQQLAEAKQKGATFITGGELSSDEKHLQPTLVTGDRIEEFQIYNDESFGPMIAITRFKTIQEAIEKANHSRYGLLASVITRNISLGEQIARRLEVGSVLINETAYTAGVSETPWGGVKESGIGKTLSDVGLYEFVNLRHIHQPRSGFLVFKSPWWFPYGPYQLRAFRLFLQLYRRQWFDKLRALPHFLVNLVLFLKNEKRL